MAENCNEISCDKAAKYTCKCDPSIRLCISHMFKHSRQQGDHIEVSLNEIKTIKKDSSSGSEKSKDSSKDLASEERVLEQVSEISQEILKRHEHLVKLKESQRLGQDLSDEITRLGKVIKSLTSKIERKTISIRKQGPKILFDKEKDSFNNHLEAIKISIVESNEFMNKAVDDILSKDQSRFISLEDRLDILESSKRDTTQELISIVSTLRSEIETLRNEKNQNIAYVNNNLQAQIDILKANNNQDVVNAVYDVRNEIKAIENENARLREKIDEFERKWQDQDNTNVGTQNTLQNNYQEFNEKIFKIQEDIQFIREQINMNIEKPDENLEENKTGLPENKVVQGQQRDQVIVPAGGGLFNEIQNMDLNQRINFFVSKGYKFNCFENPEYYKYIKQISVNRDTSEGEFIFQCKK